MIHEFEHSGWRIHPDNFKGPISGNTSFPLLIIGNTAGMYPIFLLQVHFF